MQTAPWLGLIPGADGQILQAQEGADSPIVTLFKSATVSNPGLSTQTAFYTISKQAEAAGAYPTFSPWMNGWFIGVKLIQ